MTVGDGVSLLDVADLVRGVSYKREEARPEPAPGLVPIVRANNIQDGRLVFEDLVYVPKNRVDDQQRIRKGDIVLAMSSGSPDIVGKAAAAFTDWDGGFGAFCAVLRAKPGTNWRWLGHFLQSSDYRDAVADVATGTNINNLSKTALTAVRLPRVAEQNQDEIALLLDKADATQRSSRAHLTTARRALALFRLALLAKAFSGRLTEDWRTANGKVAPITPITFELRGNRQTRRSDKRQPLSIEVLSDGPSTWRSVRLEHCVDVLDSLRKPVNSSERAKRVGDVPYYGATGQVGWIDDFLFDEELVLVGEDGAPFLDKTKSIAYLINGKSWVNNHAHVLRARRGVTSNKYLKYFLDWFDFTDYVQGSTRDKLTQTAMNSIPLIVPPFQEQEEIVRRIAELLSVAGSVDKHANAAERQLSRTAQATLAKAFRGELLSDHSNGGK